MNILNHLQNKDFLDILEDKFIKKFMENKEI